MAGIRASFYKDMKLFRKSTGLTALLLPFILLACMYFTISDTAASFIRPFSVAVIDNDHTIMSEMIISEAEAIPLFSSVDKKTEDPGTLIREGYTAVFTIPENFFYDAYTFDQKPVKVLLNSENNLQASVFSAVFTSVMGIMKTEQAVSKTVYEYRPAALGQDGMEEMYRGSSKRLLSAALSRNNIFDTKESVSDYAGALLRKLTAISMIFLLLFQAFSVCKTIPQERRLQTDARMKALGAGSFPLLASKIIFYLFLTVPSLLLFGLIQAYRVSFRIPSLQTAEYLILCFLMCASSFLSAFVISRTAKTAAAVNRAGCFLILFSLFYSGTLIPLSALPPRLSLIRLLLPAGCLNTALEAIHLNVPLKDFMEILRPVLLYCGVILLPGLIPPVLRSGRLLKTDGEKISEQNTTSFISRFFSLSAFKYAAAAGKTAGIISLAVISLLCAAIGAKPVNSDKVTIAVADTADTAETNRLTEALAEDEALLPVLTDESSARAMLASSEAEGLLTINVKCGEYLRNETEKQSGLVSYQCASSAFSASAVREIIAGHIASLKLRGETASRIEELYGITLSEDERVSVREKEQQNEKLMNDLFDLQYLNGEPAAEPFRPPYESYSAMAVLFFCLSAASWCGSRDNRQAGRRMRSLYGGKLLARGSDFFSVFLIGLTVMICFRIFKYLPLLPSFLFLLNISAFSLLITGKSEAEGKADGIIPYTAFAVCLFGGCFADMSALSGVSAVLSFLSPAGLFLHMSAGNMTAYFIVVIQTAVFVLLANQ